jgi:ABC-type bacteriocin/lantibiotic exporter with double-glycine peptidase domain
MLEVKNVAFSFAGTPPSEFDFNLSVDRGEIAVVSGRSGAGKSTLLKSDCRFFNA